MMKPYIIYAHIRTPVAQVCTPCIIIMTTPCGSIVIVSQKVLSVRLINLLFNTAFCSAGSESHEIQIYSSHAPK